jgi:hypothetical protein
MQLVPVTPPPPEKEVDLLQTMDGVIWAREFCRITGFQDEDWARVWFANAIMVGWDHHRWSTPEYKAEIAQALASSAPPPPPEKVTGPACISCGESRDGGYEVEDGPGPFCSQCWERLEQHFASSAPPPPPPAEEKTMQMLTLMNAGVRDEHNGWHDDGSGYAIVVDPQGQENHTFHIGQVDGRWLAREFIGGPLDLQYDAQEQERRAIRAKLLDSRTAAHQQITAWAREFNSRLGR